MTAKEMIDITSMRSLYAHLSNNPDIEYILQVTDNNEPLLAEIGQTMLDGNTEAFSTYAKDGKIKQLIGNEVPATNAVYCLYIPPYYVFTDLKKLYC